MLICEPCALKKRILGFERLCPLNYQDTNPARLPATAAFKRVMQWKYGPQGLLLVGASGRGKSRSAWELVRRLMVNERRRYILSYTSVNFANKVAVMFSADYLAELQDWTHALATCDLVFLDDLGKYKITERVETTLFGILEDRSANKLPVLITTQDSPDQIAARLDDHRSVALIRRIEEFCDVIEF